MPIALNEDIAGRLDEVSRILAEQEANRFRVQAYQQAATALRGLSYPVSEVFAKEGIAGLEKIPGVGETIARSIPRQYTVLFSNSARAHELNKTQDWVVLYYDAASGERQ